MEGIEENGVCAAATELPKHTAAKATTIPVNERLIQAFYRQPRPRS